jgi:hypothetical protein
MSYMTTCELPQTDAAPAGPAVGYLGDGKRRQSRRRTIRLLAAAALGGLSAAIILVYAAGSAVFVMSLRSPLRAEPPACHAALFRDPVVTVDL